MGVLGRCEVGIQIVDAKVGKGWCCAEGGEEFARGEEGGPEGNRREADPSDRGSTGAEELLGCEV